MATEHRGIALNYHCDPALLSPYTFVNLHADEDTKAWIDRCISKPIPGWAMAARNLARSVMSDYDANGLTGAHDMRVLGKAQWQALLGPQKRPRLLDVGAGDGAVTAELAPLFEEVVTTETSAQMAKRLRGAGYVCHQEDLIGGPLKEQPFDVIALLNVIDRTSRPLSLLENLRPMLKEGGELIVAVPFPLAPHAYVGAETVDPEEMLPIAKGGFELQARHLVEHLFEPLGYELVLISRAPYLSRGPSQKPVYVLDDAIFVLR